MSTGGGWQDQVGGVTSGIKYITTMPGIAQKIKVSHLDISEETKSAAEAQLNSILLKIKDNSEDSKEG